MLRGECHSFSKWWSVVSEQGKPRTRAGYKNTLLSSVKGGTWVRIHTLPRGLVRAQFIRFGIHEGERVECIERLPGGTIVLQKNRQQIALGHLLCEQILVEIIE
jgi:Fe2+ transport system protein FeoA